MPPSGSATPAVSDGTGGQASYSFFQSCYRNPLGQHGQGSATVKQETALTCTARRRVDKRQSSHSAGSGANACCNRERVAMSCTATTLQTRSRDVGEAGSHRGGAGACGEQHGCTERRRFPLRAYTGVHHDRCRPEVAVAQHRRPLSSSHWVACSSSGSQVARRLPGRHPSVTASPLRCRTGLLVGRRGSGRPPPWCLKVVFCPQAHAGHW